MESSQYIYLALSIIVWTAGFFHTGKYVRPKWKIPGKLVFYLFSSSLLIYYFNHFSLIFIIGHPLLGLIYHIKACHKHEINWVNCQPADKYLALQERWAKGDFS